ncbi:MAG: preprotein translocase subunit SecY [Spirochaetota bacterium]|nr:preprotein translocase subunit SecY [Spirochaetota bacterium]
MASVISNIFSIKELRNRLIYTIFILAVFRIGAHIPCPGINPAGLKQVFGDSSQEGFLGLLNLFSGGALGQFSLFALGIMPYISSSIIMQLLKVVVPTLDKLYKEGSYGQKKIELYTKYGTVFLCIVQSIGLLVLFSNMAETKGGVKLALGADGIGSFVGGVSTVFGLTFILTLTTGSMFLLWLGERITEKGLGNGVSMLIFAGIIARLPQAILTLVAKPDDNLISMVIILSVFAVVIGLVVAEQQATRKIPVQYAKRIIGNKMYGSQSTHIPFKINPSGVIPIIFASSVIIFPAQMLQLFGGGKEGVLQDIANYFAPGEWAYVIFYMLLVIFFAYFYTAIYFNPVEIADRLKKEGGFIPGIRPGSHTSGYLAKVLNRITLPGSIFLGLVAVFPDLLWVFTKIDKSFAYLMGGTSLLIMVSVGLETAKQIESHLLTRNMSGFMKKTKLKGR